MAKGFIVSIDERALIDLQEIIDYYNSRQAGLGKRFYNNFKRSINLLQRNPYFRIRYDQIRCLPINKFPYMIHYMVEDKNIVIYAVISTYVDPDKNKVDRDEAGAN